ncbi:MAG: tetratricopeptide repeat protein [bacterium]
MTVHKILFFILLLTTVVYPQDSTQSSAFKDKTIFKSHAVFKPKYPSYPLVAGYALQKDANQGDPFAQHELGIRYLLGVGFAPDTAKAVYWIMKAVEKKLPAAQFNYGIMLLNGIGVPWNPFEAFINFRETAKAGMGDGQYIYGILLTDNLIVNRNMNEAFKWIKKAADKKVEGAIETLHEIEKSGIINKDSLIATEEEVTTNNVVETNYSQGATLMNSNFELDFYDFEEDTASSEDDIELIEKILAKDKKELQKLLGIENEDTLKIDTGLSGIELVKIAVEAGSPEALYILGKSLEEGKGSEKDIVLAVQKYLRSLRLGNNRAVAPIIKIIQGDGFFDQLKKRVDAGDADAMYVWASLIALGFDFRLPEEEALSLLNKAVVKNHILSILEIGLCYYNGNLVEKDKLKAVEYWQKAVALGSKEAGIRIALYEILDADERSAVTKQIELLKKSSEEGSVLAQTALAFCYENGKGTKQNKAEAVKLYRKAASRGSETAYESLKRMYDELRPPEDEFTIYVE